MSGRDILPGGGNSDLSAGDVDNGAGVSSLLPNTVERRDLDFAAERIETSHTSKEFSNVLPECKSNGAKYDRP